MREKQKLAPKLRFPEFREAGEWIAMKLNDGCDVNPLNSELPEKFAYIDLESVEAGELKARKIINRDEAPSRAQRLLRHGDVIFQIVRPYQRNNFHFKIDGDVYYVASTGYAQLRANESADFLFQIVHTDDFVERVIAKCTGSNYPAINSSDLADIPIAIPNSAEQHKIADCLASLDELIALESQKLDTLKTHKKGLMQQLFPAEGETLPKLRFPEFRDAGEWVEEPLGKLSSYENGKAYEQDITDNGKYIVVNSRFISTDGSVRKYTNAEYLIAEAGDVLMVLSDLPKGKALAKCYFVEVNERYGVNQRVCRLKADRVDAKFLFYILNRNPHLLAFDDGLSQTHLSKGSVLECLLYVPQKREEQQRIADCVTSLDNLITAQTQQLAVLRTQKKGLMQQLFPVLDEVSA
ncbi:restriction endonuclease subunit S [Candidatus Thiodictyon syntrophicum]|jgi:type I restriction enzyme S subunit|uniref:Type I restriction modification DNA specificity domain-containing protein n=1 Tax=Candidatus Thiodictyon syntrophicum TaxID=1166950 RepID=A0A2K8U913_9GAMM|nr:restriction endonuclease subunit S [Candidatus Thiodictyon syntrophicum]AUB82076.1 hypothetical protein THSYN_14725 [Candidatus Thiodictyon syntrophicum]